MITFNDKVTLVDQPDVAHENKVTASDMNELKLGINNLLGTELYSDVNGSTGNIILSDSISNYDEFEVIFSRGGNGYYTSRLSTSYLTNISIITSFFSNNILRFYVANISVAGTTLTRNYTKALNFTGANQLNFGDESNLLIYKVIGYK